MRYATYIHCLHGLEDIVMKYEWTIPFTVMSALTVLIGVQLVLLLDLFLSVSHYSTFHADISVIKFTLMILCDRMCAKIVSESLHVSTIGMLALPVIMRYNETGTIDVSSYEISYTVLHNLSTKLMIFPEII